MWSTSCMSPQCPCWHRKWSIWPYNPKVLSLWFYFSPQFRFHTIQVSRLLFEKSRRCTCVLRMELSWPFQYLSLCSFWFAQINYNHLAFCIKESCIQNWPFATYWERKFIVFEINCYYCFLDDTVCYFIWGLEPYFLCLLISLYFLLHWIGLSV